MKIAFGSDHAAWELRNAVAEHARSKGIEVEVYGATGPEPFDYPDAADPVVARVLAGAVDFGVLCCGTGIGITIRANRYHGIRAANCVTTEMAQLAREHNAANVLGLGARILSHDLAIEIFDVFIATNSSQEPRHVRRVEKLDGPETC